MEERRLWSADHEPDRRPRAADPDRWPARADAPGDGGVRRRGARRLPGPGPPAAAGRAGAAPAAAGHPADGGGRRRPQPARGGDRGTVPGAGRPGGRAERPGERPGVGPAVLRPGGPPGPRAGRRVGGTRPRGGAPGARHPHLPVPPGGGARLAAHPAPRHPRRELFDELAGATTAGLVRAQALLARAIAPDDQRVAAAAAATDLQPDALRAALLQALRGGGTTTTESR